MTDVVVDTLRIRGPDGRRLAGVAARLLPAALDRALADLDGTVGRVEVRLEDPAGYDDPTLAALWADAVRVAVLVAGARRVPPARPAAVGAGGPTAGADPRHDDAASVGHPVGLPDPVQVAATVAAWLDAGARAVVPAVLGRLADAAVAAAVLDALGPVRAADLLRALRALVPQAARHAVVTDPATGQSPAAAPASGPDTAPDRPAPSLPSTGPAPQQPAPAGAAVPVPADMVAEAAAALRPVLGLAAPDGALDLALATRVAGIVLAHPWLADLCRTAEALCPGADPVHARRVALAALADPADPGLLDDPLVLLLAGAGDDPTTAAFLAPLEAADDVRAAAEDVTARFAALLPGFERSTPGFVRAGWLVRPGVLDPTTDPVRLLARSLPLDVVLSRLPYPVTLARLPWTPPITVRFAP